MPTTTITITRKRVAHRFGQYWLYEAQGPDTIQIGERTLPRRFDNRSLVELRRVLRRNYPGYTLNESWRQS